jgi:lysyl-tRNA synthetase class 2
MIQETADFLQMFLGDLSLRCVTYREAFQQFGVPHEDPHYVLSHFVEPHLGQGELTALIDYPPEEAALACVQEGVAKRFEIYYQGVELCNGYLELSDAAELRRRFTQENHARVQRGEKPYALDEEFLSSLRTLPPCAGVSVGLDRVLMLKHKMSMIEP